MKNLNQYNKLCLKNLGYYVYKTGEKYFVIYNVYQEDTDDFKFVKNEINETIYKDFRSSMAKELKPIVKLPAHVLIDNKVKRLDIRKAQMKNYENYNMQFNACDDSNVSVDVIDSYLFNVNDTYNQNPLEYVIKKDFLDTFTKCLTPKQMEAAINCYLYGFTQEECAKILGISIDSVKNRLAGVRKKALKFKD